MLISAEDITSGDVDETVYQIVFTLGDLSGVDMDIKAICHFSIIFYSCHNIKKAIFLRTVR